MTAYHGIVIWIMAFSVFSAFTEMKREETVCGRKEYRYKVMWAVIAILPLLYMTATRGYVGDTGGYMRGFGDMPNSISGFPEFMDTIKKDRGFYAFSALIHIFITKDTRVYFAILGAIQLFCLVKVYRKYSSDYVLSIFLFLVSTDYISWMFNGIRQFLAVTITFLCCPLLLKKKYVPAVILILLASQIHGTALLMLPIIFIVQGDAWNKKTLLLIAVIILAVTYVDSFTNILDTMLQDTQYQNVVSDWESWQDDGTNVLRVAVYSVPAVLSLIGLKYIRHENNPLINLCTNMSIVSMGIYLVSMVTSGIFVGRLPIYCSLYGYILLPWEMEHMFNEESAKVMKIMMILGYIAFYLYSIRGWQW